MLKPRGSATTKWRKSIIYNTSLTAINDARPLTADWERLLAYLGKTKADDEPLPLAVVYKATGPRFAIWCLRALPNEHAAAVRTLACDMAETQMKWVPEWDEHPHSAIVSARAYVNGNASIAQMEASGKAAEAGFLSTYHRANGYHWNAANAAAATCLPDAAIAANQVYEPAFRDDQEPVFSKWLKHDPANSK